MSDLLEATAELIGIPSLSHAEHALADLVEERLSGCAWLEVTRLGDNVVARTAFDRPQRLVLAGHLDTVPPNHNEEPNCAQDCYFNQLRRGQMKP